VSRCLEKRPDDRFTSAHDLAFALQALEESSPRELPRPRQPRSGGPQGWVAAALGVVVVTAAGWWLATRGRAASLPEFHPRRVATRLTNVLDAALSPDGNEIAYSAEEGGASDVWVVDVRGGKPIRLTDGSSLFSGPAWFPDGGSIAYTSNQGAKTSIWRIPRFGGTAMLLVSNAQDVSISPTGGHIAFARPDEHGNLRIWESAIGDLAGAHKLTADGIGVWEHRHPAWSPDGRSICFQDKRNLWLVPAAGGQARSLTAGDAVNSNPVWSAGGRHVYFASLRDGVKSLWRAPVDGGEAVRVTHGAGTEESPSVSSAGLQLAFVSGQETRAIALLDVATGKLGWVRLGRVTEYPSIAPDRSAIVFESDLGGVSDLWSQPLRGNMAAGDPARLTDHPGTCALPAYSPDGRWIAYWRVIDGQRDVWVVPSEGGAPVNFTDTRGIDAEPAWSPDGGQIAFVSDRDGREQVWVAPFAAGRRAGEARRVTDEEGGTSFPCWSPDGTEIAYVVSAGTSSDVRVADVAARRSPRRVTEGAQARTVRWWRDRNRLLVAGYWGQRLPSIRLVSPAGGDASVVAVPAEVALELDFPVFDVARDGSLLALCHRSKQAELWILRAEKGSF
jgi:Tol biopolymer transport system component